MRCKKKKTQRYPCTHIEIPTRVCILKTKWPTIFATIYVTQNKKWYIVFEADNIATGCNHRTHMSHDLYKNSGTASAQLWPRAVTQFQESSLRKVLQIAGGRMSQWEAVLRTLGVAVIKELTIRGMRARLRGGRPCAGSATGVGPLLRRYCYFN